MWKLFREQAEISEALVASKNFARAQKHRERNSLSPPLAKEEVHLQSKQEVVHIDHKNDALDRLTTHTSYIISHTPQ
jgi:hypothetical protein